MGGCRIRSRTSVAYSGESEATICSNLVFCAVMPRVANWASTWANQTSGSDGQNGGSLRLIAETPPVSGSVRGSTDMASRRSGQKGRVACRGHHLSPAHNQVHNNLTYTAYSIYIHTPTCVRMFWTPVHVQGSKSK